MISTKRNLQLKSGYLPDMRERIGFHPYLRVVSLLVSLLFTPPVHALGICEPSSTISVGAGYVDAHTTGGIIQLEYKWDRYLWKRWRPHVTLLSPMLRSFFFGIGLGFELPLTERITLTPSFTPGLYFKGKGLNLGYPLEFRSALELAHRMSSGLILGVQAFHISNAHLGSRNPGMNACIVFCGWQFGKGQ